MELSFLSDLFSLDMTAEEICVFSSQVKEKLYNF